MSSREQPPLYAHLVWTEEQESVLRKAWKRGRTASEIAKDLKGHETTRPITRDMVIGKARRLGLAPRPSPIKRELADA